MVKELTNKGAGLHKNAILHKNKGNYTLYSIL